MKKTNITIQYDEEKLDTLNVYLNDKGIVLSDEIGKMIDSLYNKHVPQSVRDFFSKKSGSAPTKRPSNSARTQTTKKPSLDGTEAQN